MKAWPLLFISLFLTACLRKQPGNQQKILGTWQRKVFRTNKPGEGSAKPPPLPASFEMSGMNFAVDGKFENRDGYFSNDGNYQYLGVSSRYRVTTDSLFIYSPGDKTWHHYKLLKLNADTLVYGNPNNSYLRFKPDISNRMQFDSIIISSSGCYGGCAVMNLMVSRNGDVEYHALFNNKNEGHFKSYIKPEFFNELQDRFTLMDLIKLKDRYIAHHTDDETITVSFVKNGRVYKTIMDYGHDGPPAFRWAYLQLRHVPDKLKLTREQNQPKYLSQYDNFRTASLIKDGMILDILQTETFLLFQYLNNGKRTDHKFSPTYRLVTGFEESPIMTDGRYFQLKSKEETVTIDIGFDFFLTNIRNRMWRKQTEYDYK